MPDFNDVQATARRIRAAVESLTDPEDLRVVRDYLSELGASGRSAGSRGRPGKCRVVH